MGWRFRKGIKLAPGLRVNLSKGLPSLSIGGKGLTCNIGAKGTRTSVGIPGSGLSYSTYDSHGARGRGRRMPVWVWLILAVAALYFAGFFQT